MPETFTEVAHKDDLSYQVRRQQIIDQLMKLRPDQLERQLRYQMAQAAPRDEGGAMTKSMMQELRGSSMIPSTVKGLLDSSGGTTGNVLIRQDLEPTLYTLFVKTFPAWERMRKGQANGLVHAANQITSPDSSALGSTITTELGAVSYVASTFVRQTYPIAVFATGRGVSFKELAAVSAGGMSWDPSKLELANGMVKLALDTQFQLLQGNATNSAGASASNEKAAYNANGFDGWRGVLGSVGSFSGNNSIIVDQGSLTMLESIQYAAAKMANNGGNPSAVFMSMNAKQALDQEQLGNARYNMDVHDITPGVRVNRVSWVNGELDVIPIPGTTMGTYNRTSDSALVEDIYIIDESTNCIRWLYSEGFTVLQIPSGVDGQLSERYIVFGMYGLEQAAPLFNGKVRRLAS